MRYKYVYIYFYDLADASGAQSCPGRQTELKGMQPITVPLMFLWFGE